MGRKEKRLIERKNRLSNRKGKVLLTRSDISKIRDDEIDRTAKYDTEALMACFALANHRLYGHGQKRIFRSLEYIDTLMGDILEGRATVDDYFRELREETGIVIKC